MSNLVRRLGAIRRGTSLLVMDGAQRSAGRGRRRRHRWDEGEEGGSLRERDGPLGTTSTDLFLSQQIAEFFRASLGLQRLMTTSAASSSYFFTPTTTKNEVDLTAKKEAFLWRENGGEKRWKGRDKSSWGGEVGIAESARGDSVIVGAAPRTGSQAREKKKGQSDIRGTCPGWVAGSSAPA